MDITRESEAAGTARSLKQTSLQRPVRGLRASCSFERRDTNNTTTITTTTSTKAGWHSTNEQG